MRKLTVILVLLCFFGCKKEEDQKVSKTLTIAITGVVANSTYDITCTDSDNKDASGKATVVFSVKAGTENKSYTTQVYSTQSIAFLINKSAGKGALATLSVDGKTLGRVESNVSSGGIVVTIP